MKVLDARRTLLVVIGAGASMPAGVPGVADVTQQIDKYLPSTADPGDSSSSPAHALSLVFPSAYGDAFRSAMHSYFDNASRGTTYTFENVLSALEELDDWKFELPFMSRLAEFKPAFADLTIEASPGTARADLIAHVHEMIGHEASLPAVQSHLAANNVRDLLENLAEQFRLIVIDLNYDDIVDNAKIRWEDGFSMPVADALLFDPRDWSHVVADGSHLLIHLHGSVRFGQLPRGARWISGPEEPAKYPSFAIARTHRSASGSHAVVDGRSYSAPYIISGAGKGAKFIYNLRPYGFYTAALATLAPLVSGMLTIGYGWADPHVNTLIRDLVATSPLLPKAIVTRRCGADVGEYTHLDTEQWYRRISHAEIDAIDGIATVERAASTGQRSWTSGSLILLPCGLPFAGTERGNILAHLA